MEFMACVCTVLTMIHSMTFLDWVWYCEQYSAFKPRAMATGGSVSSHREEGIRSMEEGIK